MTRYGPAPLPSAPRTLLHLLAIVAGWALFVWGWVEVASRPWQMRELWLLIIGALVVLPALTAAWILHNFALFRRKGPRRTVPVAERPYDRDWAQRPVQADWAALAGASAIAVEIEAGIKRFRALDALPGDVARRTPPPHPPAPLASPTGRVLP